MTEITKNKPAIIFLCLFFAIFSPFSVYAVSQEIVGNDSSVTVLASTSLSGVMTELIRIYSAKSGQTVSATYDAPSDLARTIEEGGISDIYISEDQEIMRDLKRQGLIDVFSLTTLATNKLVLVAASTSNLSKTLSASVPLNELLDSLNSRTLLVIANPATTPAGQHAMLVLSELGHWEKIKDYTIRAPTDSNALYMIAKGNTAGMVYYTDAHNNPEVKIISGFPATKQNFVVYQAAVVAGENMSDARDFLAFLKSDRAKKVFEKYGFSTL